MSIAKKSLVVTCLFLLSASMAQARHDKPKDYLIPDFVLSVTARQHILQDHFITVNTVQAIPHPVLKLLLGKDPLESMADFGKPFQRGDVITGPEHLPSRRLIFAALSDYYCLVYNEYGGYAYGRNVTVYHLSAGKAKLVWRATLLGEESFLSLPQLQSRIGEGKFDKLARKEYDW